MGSQVAAEEGSLAAAGDSPGNREAAARGSPVAALGSSAAAQCIQAAAVEGNQGNLLLAAAAVGSLGYKAGCCSFSILSDAATLNVLVMLSTLNFLVVRFLTL